jgi:asparagine synthase (glutamine-hydrolysing)
MAAIIGFLGARPQVVVDVGCWDRCIDRLRSRCDSIGAASARAATRYAFLGDVACGFFEDDRRVVMLDGTVDNLEELLAEVPGAEWGANPSAAASIAALWDHSGEQILKRLTGSFALAMLEPEAGVVTLARDRFGTKPLFYAAVDGGWAWASEIKGLLPVLERVEIDRVGLGQALRYRWTLGSRTMIEGVRQVLPAGMVRFAPDRPAQARYYWRLEFPGAGTDGGLSMESWVDRVDAGLDSCFRKLGQRHRDVGILLSGGVDSSLLALKAARGGFRNCIALTARWPGENPELESARAVARHLDIEHIIIDVDEAFLEAYFPRLIWRMEELPRHYNSFILARLFEEASSRVPVLLHGEAADALFGPQECIAVNRFARRQAPFRLIPRPLRMAIARLLPERRGGRVARLDAYLRRNVDDYLLGIDQIEYANLAVRAFPQYSGTDSLDLDPEHLDAFYDRSEGLTERFQRYHIYAFCHSHLTVLDRLSTPAGVAVHMPFLTPELVSVASQLPTRLKTDGPSSKPVLKALAARDFPHDWIYRPKHGFPTPTTRWLQGPLNRWIRMLFEEQTAAHDLLDLGALASAQVGPDNELLWTAMSLEMFRRQFLEGRADAL